MRRGYLDHRSAGNANPEAIGRINTPGASPSRGPRAKCDENTWRQRRLIEFDVKLEPWSRRVEQLAVKVSREPGKQRYGVLVAD